MIREFVIKDFKGLNTDIDSYDFPDDATSAVNVNYSRRPGALTCRRPFALSVPFSSPQATSTQVLGFHPFVTKTGDRQIVVRHTRGWAAYSMTGNPIKSPLVGAGGMNFFFSQSSTSFVTPTFAPFQGRIWCCDGLNLYSWNGTVFRRHRDSTDLRDWPPQGTQYIFAYQNRLWAGGFVNRPTRLIYSSTSTIANTGDGGSVKFSPSTNRLEFGQADPNDCLKGALAQHGQVANCMVFKRNTTWILLGDSKSTFKADRLAEGVGCMGPRAMVHTEGGAYWLDYRKIFRFDGLNPVASVGMPVRKFLDDNMSANHGFKAFKFFAHSSEAKTATYFAYGRSADWTLTPSTGRGNVMTYVSTARTTGSAAAARIGFPKPCLHSYTFTFVARLPATSNGPRQRLYLLFRGRHSVPYSGFGRVIYVSYGPYSTRTLGGWGMDGGKLYLGYISANSTMQRLASVQFHNSGSYNAWIRISVDLFASNVRARISRDSGTNAFSTVSCNAVLGGEFKNHSTQKFQSWFITNSAATTAAQRGRYDSVAVHVWLANNPSQLAYNAYENQVVAMLNKNGSTPATRTNLTYDVLTQRFGSFKWSAACFGNFLDDRGQTWLGFIRQPRSNASLRACFFPARGSTAFPVQMGFEGDLISLAWEPGGGMPGYSARDISVFWRTGWLSFGAPDADKTLRHVRLGFERKATTRLLKVIVSAKDSPYAVTGRTARANFSYYKPDARQDFNLAGKWFRLGVSFSGRASTFNLSQVAMGVDMP